MENIYVFLVRLAVILVSVYLVTAFAFCSFSVVEWGLTGRVIALFLVGSSIFLFYKSVKDE